METVEKKTLREAREEAGLNREELAELIGASPATISKLERGRMKPDSPSGQRVCEALGLPLDQVAMPQYTQEHEFFWDEDGFAPATPRRPLAAWRERRGMTVEDLAHLAGLHMSVIWRIETGKPGSIKPRTRRNLVHALRVDPAKLLLPGDNALADMSRSEEDYLRSELRAAQRVLRRWQDAARDGRYLTNRGHDDLTSLIEDTERELRGT